MVWLHDTNGDFKLILVLALLICMNNDVNNKNLNILSIEYQYKYY